MTIPFLSYFKRKPKVEAEPLPPPPPLDKPSSEKFSKTVMPSSARSVTPMAPALAAATDEKAPPAAPASPSKAGSPRSIAFAAPGASPNAMSRPQIPPAVAVALEPKVERVISLELRDILPQVPAGLAHPLETLDGNRRVLFKAAEVEKGMANGRPTVSLTSIHQQLPEIFLKPVAPDDMTQVQLPFAKVLEEFTKLQVRADQVRQNAAPQVATPFLKVAREDGEKFGTPIEKLETTELPAVRVELEPATAENIANAEPEPVIEAPGARSPVKMPAASSAPSSTAAPKRIAFKLSPNGTDVSATERVPASGGASVPQVTSNGAAAAPARIPFKLEPSLGEEESAPKPEPWLTAAAFGLPPRNQEAAAEKSGGEADDSRAKKSEPKIRLGLHTVLKALPEFQLSGDAESVPKDVALELPFAIVEAQLASGRVTLAPDVFAAAIPQSFRSLFRADCAAEVALPLQEVLKNLPAASLKMRDDQVTQEIGATFETPFSKTAAEDAERFKVEPETAPVAEDDRNSAEAPEEAEEPPTTATTGESVRTPLQVALDTNERLDAKGVVAHINQLTGVKASAFLFQDGLNLAGNLPPDVEAEGLCAMAPTLLQRVETHVADTKLGALRGMTLACAKGTLTFFMHENLCLAALHSNGEIPTDVREKLSRVVHEMSRKYSPTV
jgi:predicted regulator of Ras-like GTPase activity (Roadblock/LC7/MglB family)